MGEGQAWGEEEEGRGAALQDHIKTSTNALICFLHLLFVFLLLFILSLKSLQRCHKF